MEVGNNTCRIIKDARGNVYIAGEICSFVKRITYILRGDKYRHVCQRFCQDEQTLQTTVVHRHFNIMAGHFKVSCLFYSD